MFRQFSILALSLLMSTAVIADDDWGEHRHHHHHHGHHHGHHYRPTYRERIVYAPPVVEYVQTPPVYYAPPPPVYYAPPPPPPRYSYDQRSPQGLLGGMVGSAMGYEIGRGDPLAAGLGAAAGAWMGATAIMPGF